MEFLEFRGSITDPEDALQASRPPGAADAQFRILVDPGLIEGLTQDQRFFIAHAHRWAEKARDEFLVTLVQTDSHAPALVRAVQRSRNMEEFFTAFAIKPGDPMYLAPEERIVIW